LSPEKGDLKARRNSSLENLWNYYWDAVPMGYHYHLLVETPEGNRVSGMKWLHGSSYPRGGLIV
jgi:hypothetical protein